MQDYAYLLAIDTCGSSGSVALGQQVYGAFHILGESQFDGRRSSDSVVGAVREILSMAEAPLPRLSAIIAVNGPGGFTGVRIGLSAVKGLAESSRIPVTAVSRLEVLADKANIPSAALDAHRDEVFLRLELPGGQARELLAGSQELSAVDVPPLRIAVCDEAAAALLATVWPAAELVRTSPPTAADALRFGVARVDAGESVDVALLDGHYLRRSDAEIFGPESLGRPAPKGPQSA